MTDIARFDRDLTLTELLRATPRTKLEKAITSTVGNRWQLVDVHDAVLLGPGIGDAADASAIPIRIDIEVVGKLLVAGATRAQLELATAWIDMAFASAGRYQMAVDLHMEAIHADYEALQHKHAALQESETRYRELSEQLEQRVKDQVAIIERAQRQLYQAEKMASVGSLAAGMAHEINNPIGFIRSNLSTAQTYIDKIEKVLSAFHNGDPGAKMLWNDLDIGFMLEDFPGLIAESLTGTDRVARIIANLKAYSNIDCIDEIPVDLNDAVRAAMAIATDQFPSTIKFSTDLQPLPKIVCDQSRINQVLFSLMQNARQAMEGDGTIRIATRCTGGEVRVSVTDTGCGIAPAIVNRIFDPFFTTRDVGKGMGLGLTVSRDVITAHGGRIEVETAVDSGSTFTVCLPVQQSGPSESQP